MRVRVKPPQRLETCHAAVQTWLRKLNKSMIPLEFPVTHGKNMTVAQKQNTNIRITWRGSTATATEVHAGEFFSNLKVSSSSRRLTEVKEAVQKPFCPSSNQKCHSGCCEERVRKKPPRFLRKHHFYDLVLGRLNQEDLIWQSWSDRQRGESSWRVWRCSTGHTGRETRQDTKPPPHVPEVKMCGRSWALGGGQWLPPPPSSQAAQSFFCFASFLTILSSSLRDFCSSSRNCFIHLFSCCPRQWERRTRRTSCWWSPLNWWWKKVRWCDQHTHFFQLVDLIL